MAEAGVYIEGLRELNKELRRLDDKGFRKELRKTNKGVVEQVLMPDVRQLANETRTNLAGNPTRLGTRGAKSIRAASTGTKAQIAVGRKGLGHVMGHVFGSKNYAQFPPWKKGGHIVWPVVAEKRQEFMEQYGDMLDDLTKRAFPD